MSVSARPPSGLFRGLQAAFVTCLLGCGGTGALGPTAPAPAAPAAAGLTSVDEILRTSDLPDPLPTPLPGDPLGVTIHRLENGLTVYISTDRQQPRVSAWIALRTGSRHDPADSTGLAHYLEHMMFRGTSKIGALDPEAERPHLDKIAAHYAALFTEKDEAKRNSLLAAIDAETQASVPYIAADEVRRLYAGLGAWGLNASTYPDFTRYVVDIPSNRLEHWARIDSERLTNPSFRMFFTELEAVYEERNKNNDEASRRVHEANMAALFPAHPYGQLNGGSAEHLKNPAFHNMVAFYKRWYVPNNTAIVLAGDIDAATALPVIRAHFSDWQARPLPAPPPGEVRPPTGRKPVEVHAKGMESANLTWLTVPASHADMPALYVMNLLMANSKSGLLERELRLPQKVLNADTSWEARHEAGFWTLTGVARQGQSLDEVESLLLETVAHLKEGRFRDEDLTAPVLNVEIGRKAALESNQARVEMMFASFIAREPWSRASRWLARLRAVTKADVVRVAQQYLRGDFVATRRKNSEPRLAKIPKPKMTPLSYAAGRKSAFALSLDALPVKPLEPEWVKEGVHYQRGRLPAGKLLTAFNRRNDLFSLVYDFERGARQEPLLCQAVDVLARAGAGELSAAARKERFYHLGVSVNINCGINGSGLSLSGPDSTMEEALRLVDTWFREPRFGEEEVKNQLSVVLDSRKNALTNPRAVASALGSYVDLARNSPYLLAPSNQQLQRADRTKLRSLMTSFLDHQHKTRYFGPRPAAAAAPLIALGQNHRPLRPRAPTRYRRVTKDTVHLMDRDMAQAQVELTFATGPTPPQERALSLLLSRYLSGGVAYEIRETRGLAYSAEANHAWGGRRRDEGALFGSLATQPDKTPEALARMLYLFREMPVEEVRFNEAKRALEEEWRATRPNPRGVTADADFWDGLGERGDIRPRLRAEVAALRARDLEAYLRRLAKRPVAIAVTGDKKRLGLVGNTGFKLVEPSLDSLHNYGAFPPAPPAVASR